jgi:hypothetical protein
MAKLAPTLLSVLALCAATAMPQTTGSVFSFAGVAQAANPMVELVSGGDVTGDGATPVVLHMVAFNPDGTAMNGASLKLSAQGGSVGRVSMVQPGLYAAEWTPPSVDETSNIQLTVKGKTPTKIAVTQSWAVTVQPTLDQQVTVQANPAEITLGRDSNATLNIMLSGGAGRSLDGSDLIVRANSGTIENVTHLGGGRFAASYKPPAKFFPHVALITVADKRNPNRTYGSLSIPLVGKANFPVVGQPNSSVMVRIDDREYGPVASDSNGRAQVPLEVRPGFVEARVLSVANGQKNRRSARPSSAARKPSDVVPLVGGPRFGPHAFHAGPGLGQHPRWPARHLGPGSFFRHSRNHERSRARRQRDLPRRLHPTVWEPTHQGHLHRGSGRPQKCASGVPNH